MAKRFKVSIPFMLRSICGDLFEALQIELGVPMNAELPGSTEDHSTGVAKIHFPRNHFRVEIETHRGHYGQYVHILSVLCKLSCTDEFIENLSRFSGPLEVTWDARGHKCFKLSPRKWTRLSVNASHRRNDLPQYEWDDPKHPGRKDGETSYPELSDE